MALAVFVRGLNVGGRRVFRPAQVARELHAFDVVNIGAAGTFVVRQPGPPHRFVAALREKLPFDAAVACCAGEELLRLVAGDPFSAASETAGDVRFVSVLSEAARCEVSLPVELPDNREWLVRIIGAKGRFVFGLYRRQMKTIGYLGQIDRLFGALATTRSWSTMLAVARILRA